MLIIFKSDGEYKNDDVNVIISKKDVESEKEFNIFEKNAKSYIRAGLATLAEEIKEQEQPSAPTTLEDVNTMSVPELKAYAEKEKIDLGEATKKDDILEAVVKTFEEK